MYHHPYDLEINAAYARERVMAFAEATRRLPETPRTKVQPGTPPAPGWLRRGLGRRMIAVGEWLAGPTICPPAAAGPAV